MSDRTKSILKFFGLGVLWVYVLSIRVGQQTLFHYANDILVQNQIVEAIDRQLLQAYEEASKGAGDVYARITGRNKGM